MTTEMVCHGIAWYFMVFHGISWYFMVFHVISIISAPHNMGVDTLFVQLSSSLTEIWPTNEISVMAALICIKIARGTFCLLVNIANRFLRILFFPIYRH